MDPGNEKGGSSANKKLYARVSAPEKFVVTPTFDWTHLLFPIKLTLSIMLCISILVRADNLAYGFQDLFGYVYRLILTKHAYCLGILTSYSD